MKRIVALFLSVFLMFSLLGCDSKNEEPSSKVETSLPTEATTEPTVEETLTPVESLKILAIGNSFSVDAMEHLYTVAKAEGVKEIVLGNLYVGGCTLKMHANYMSSDAPEYRYYKNTTGVWSKTEGYTLLQGLQDEQWDIITMQQGSAVSGLVDSFDPYLDQLIAYVNENKTNPDAKLVWHMTWAYQGNSTHKAFPNYGNSQQSMYYGIVNAVQKVIRPKSEFSLIIPVGTAVQNARGSFLGDTLTRDGHHLNDTGRLIASYTWYSALTGRELVASKIQGIPSVPMSAELQTVIANAVNSAISAPDDVTRI